MTCCHVSKVTKNTKTRNLQELLNGHNESYRSPTTNLNIHCKCLPSQRYCMMNGYGTTSTRYQHRKQQFGRWHEEPAFGSRYAFDNETSFNNNNDNNNRQTNSVTNTPSAKTKLTSTTNQNDININSKSTQANNDNDDMVNDDDDDNVNNNDNDERITITNNRNHIHHKSLIKSSSIDTIAVSFVYFKSYIFFPRKIYQDWKKSCIFVVFRSVSFHLFITFFYNVNHHHHQHQRKKSHSNKYTRGIKFTKQSTFQSINYRI